MRRTSPGIDAARQDGADGFVLMELLVALLVVALLASIAWPRAHATARAAELYQKAGEVGALLRQDRNAALASGRIVLSRVDTRGGLVVTAGSTATRIALAPGTIRARYLPGGGGGGNGIAFFPDGRSSGGALVIDHGGRSLRIDVSGPTSAVTISSWR